MNHVAIMKKSWKLIPKILVGEKTVESRWYKAKVRPWDKIKSGDTLYFKDSGEPVTVKSKVTKVLQYKVSSNEEALKIMRRYAKEDLGLETVPEEIKDYIRSKKYAIFIFFDSVEKIKPFEINKTGFGNMSAWITVNDIKKIKVWLDHKGILEFMKEPELIKFPHRPLC